MWSQFRAPFLELPSVLTWESRLLVKSCFQLELWSEARVATLGQLATLLGHHSSQRMRMDSQAVRHWYESGLDVVV